MKTFLIIILLFALPVHGTGENQNTGSIEIGVLLCLTGNCADWGNSALKGARLAVNEINDNGGVLNRPLRLRVEDTRESISGSQAVTAFKKLTEINNLHFLIGPSWSPGAVAITPLASSRNDLLIITPSASAESFNESAQQLFNMRPAERLATESLAQYVLHRGWTKAAIFTSQQQAESTQGKIFAAEFSRSGGKIVEHLETNPEHPELRAEALRIIKSSPDVVFLMAYNQMNAAAKSLRDLGYSGHIVTISIDNNRVEAAKGVLEGVYVAKALPPEPGFLRKFKQRYSNEEPGLSAENGYDAVYALAQAITEAKSIEVSNVVKALGTVKFSGAAGTIAFDDNGAVKQEPALYVVQGGRLKPVGWAAGSQTGE